MNKKEYNDNCKVLLQENKIDFDMLLQAYANLNKQVSRYAYLKKKFANSGKMNDTNIHEFNIAIQKRNVIEKVLKSNYRLSVDDIKDSIKDMAVLISQPCCDELVKLFKSDSFEIVS